jgi:hypothetical protein
MAHRLGLRLFGASSLGGDDFGVDFARRDLSGKIAHPAGPQGRIQPGVGGDAGNSRLAHKARPPEYAGAFAENGIDVSVLPHLTDQDLKDIGVLLGWGRTFRFGRRGAADRYCSSQSRKNGFFWPGVAAGLPCASNPVFATVSCDVVSAVDASEATGPGGGALKAAGTG